MGFFLAVMAALCNAISSVLQRRGASTAPESSVLRVNLMTYVLRRPVWLIGFSTMVGAFLFQAAALSYGQLSTVQPVLVTELLFVLIILSIWSRSRPGREEWIGALAVTGGLAGFLLAASPAGGSTDAMAGDWGVAGAGTGVVVLALIAIARTNRSPFARAALFGSAAAITFALNAAFIKASTNLIGQGTVHFFASWPPYAVAVTGLAAFFILTNAFQSGPLTATQPALTVVDPMASIIIGAEVFGETLRDSPGWVALEVVTLLIMAVGVVLLSRGPLVSTEMGEATAGRAKGATPPGPLPPAPHSRAVGPSGRSG
ncbi:MAG TPA: DMT family transporter [Acidimicrobiales bacterium]|jgi:drug/metabolite transporter (DMT)-like permease|nr:DMT family transporter [Acidimicrobiales bacterium]